MKRIINSDSKNLELSRSYSQKRQLKPIGLWYSIGNEWIEWCESNVPKWVREGIFELNVDTKNILIIETVEQLKEFSAKFSYEICQGVKYIDWEKIACSYSGIEIRNYYELKWNEKEIGFMDNLWLYAWDVSSGCIWDLSVVKSFSYQDLAKLKTT